MGEDILAGNMDFDLVDDYVRVTDRDSMIMTRRLAREEGMFVGQSCGMAAAGALQWLRSNAKNLKSTDVVVVVSSSTVATTSTGTGSSEGSSGFGSSSFAESSVPDVRLVDERSS